MIALTPGLVWICAFGRAGLIAIHGLYRGIQIENQLRWQAGSNDLLIQPPQFVNQRGTETTKPDQFLVQQTVMRAAAAEKAPQQHVALQTTEMKNPFAAKHPANDEIEQNTVNGEEGVARFAAGEAAHRLRQFDFFEKGQEDFDAAAARCVL